jgi:DNA repair protein SbcC/Rad50
MRPVRLRVSGFTCFKTEQIIPFDSLELFAISGPTGAGKSSLLDTMVYALYGCVPRVGKRGYTEFISLGQTRMSVCFDFQIGDKVYRVTRTARRLGAPSAQIEELTDSGDTKDALADGIAAVDKLVQEILGLDYESFLQAVVLPQGDFAKFLKSRPGDRTRLLRELLRLGRYEEMRKDAQTRSSAAETEIEHLEQRLAEDYGGASVEVVETLEQKLGQDKKEIARLRKSLQAADVETKNARRLRERTSELESRRAEQAEVARKQKVITEHERRLEASRRAAKVAPLLDQFEAAKDRAGKVVEELRTAEQGVRRAAEREGKALANAGQAERAARQVPEIDKQLQKIAEIIGLTEPTTRLQQSIKGLEREQSKLEDQLGQCEANRQKEMKRLERARKELVTAEQVLDRIAFDPKLHEKLEEVSEIAASAQHLAGSVRELHKLAEEASREAAETKKSANAIAQRVETSARGLERAITGAKDAESALQQAEQAHTAHQLRGQLRVGRPCPVCEQSVEAIPKAGRIGIRIDDLRNSAEEARATATRKREEHADLQAEAKTAARSAILASKRAEKARDDENIKSKEYDDAGRRIATWRRNARIELETPVERHVLRLISELRKKRKTHDEAVEGFRGAEKERNEAQQAVEKIDDQVSTAREKLTRVQEQLKEAAEQMGEYQKRIRAVVGDDDAQTARESLREEREQLEERREATRRAAAEASKQLVQTRALLSSVTDQSREANKDLNAIKSRVHEDLREAGFESASSARAALLDEKTSHKWVRETREHQQELATLESRIEELEKELGDREVSQQELKRKEEERDGIAASLERTTGGLRVTEEQIRLLRERIVKAQELRGELQSQKQVARVYGVLADELQSNHFQHFLLQETLEDLVSGASERLKKMSDRYSLILREGEFFVIDQDNAGEQRSADTLSGGETFLTSLALALELSAQVQRAAGALRLDSIFIDEGFGTLDPDTLETVVAAIEALPVGGRMVGIITHIAELTNRLPGQIAIEKTISDGSRIQVRT